MAKAENTSRINALRSTASDATAGKANCLQLHLALPISATCPVCRVGFERVTGGRGRPLRFCSDACRHLELRRQQRAWVRRRQSTSEG